MNRFIRAWFKTYLSARSAYQAGPVNEHRQPMRVFLCGGGANVKAIARVPGHAAHQFGTIGLARQFDVTPFPQPDHSTFEFEGLDYTRMSVAHGLCQLALSLGEVSWPEDLDPVVYRLQEQADRDEDR